jgi:hypothetical protein
VLNAAFVATKVNTLNGLEMFCRVHGSSSGLKPNAMWLRIRCIMASRRMYASFTRLNVYLLEQGSQIYVSPRPHRNRLPSRVDRR